MPTLQNESITKDAPPRPIVWSCGGGHLDRQDSMNCRMMTMVYGLREKRTMEMDWTPALFYMQIPLLADMENSDSSWTLLLFGLYTLSNTFLSTEERPKRAAKAMCLRRPKGAVEAVIRAARWEDQFARQF